MIVVQRCCVLSVFNNQQLYYDSIHHDKSKWYAWRKMLIIPLHGNEMLIDIFQTLKTGEQLHYLQNWIIIILIPSFLWLSDYELVLRTNMSPIHTRSLQYHQLRVQKNSIIVTTQCKKCVSASSAAELYIHPIIDYIRLDDCWLHLTTYTCINQHQHKHQAST